MSGIIFLKVHFPYVLFISVGDFVALLFSSVLGTEIKLAGDILEVTKDTHLRVGFNPKINNVEEIFSS